MTEGLETPAPKRRTRKTDADKAVETMKRFVSTDPTRENLTRIHTASVPLPLKPYNSWRKYMFATDGHTALIRLAPYSEQDCSDAPPIAQVLKGVSLDQARVELTWDVLEQLEGLVRGWRHDVDVVFRGSLAMVTLSSEKARLTSKLGNCVMHGIEAVKFNARYLIRLADALEGSYQTGLTLRSSDEFSPWIAEGRVVWKDALGVVMPMRRNAGE